MIKQGLAVPHRTTGPASHQFDCFAADADSLGFTDRGETVRDLLDSNQAKVKPLASRQDRVGQGRRLGRTEDELDRLGGLFEGLEQCVEGLVGQLMDFIDDVDLVPRPHALDAHIASQVANILDPPIRGAIDFQHIDILPGSNARADVAFVARPVSLGARAIERHGENPGHRRLADTSSSGEEIRVRDPTTLDRVPQPAGDMFLPNHLVEGRRAKPSGQDRVVSVLFVHGLTSEGHLVPRPRKQPPPGHTSSDGWRDAKGYLRMHLRAKMLRAASVKI